ncbi:MAG: OmpA family protein [Muribaculaceae bacterium]|nr:OmpA family protein [Muribaculaceae bacterium]
MKLNKIFLTATLLFAGVCANAQETVTEYVFQPHWYGQLQIGGQETVGEGKFGKLLSGNAQIAVGYKFNPYIGMRLAVNAWASRGAAKLSYFDNGSNHYYKWNYVAPTLDAVVDLTNLIGGYNPTRLVEVDLLAGLGVNIGFHNKDAQNLNAAFNNAFNNYLNTNYPKSDLQGNPILYNETVDKNVLRAWDGTKCRFLGQFGCAVNFNVSSRVQIGLELMANVVPDTYNSKIVENTDWYFNALLGVGYSFGPRYNVTTRVIEEPAPEPVVVEKIVEKIVEVPVQVEEKKVEKEVFRRDVFFLINQYVIRPQEMEKVAQVAEYLQSHPQATVTITGYADKGTGSMAFNLRLSAQRSQAVAKALQDKYYIPASRMIVKSMGEDMYQPYPDAVQNRVAICIAE